MPDSLILHCADCEEWFCVTCDGGNGECRECKKPLCGICCQMNRATQKGLCWFCWNPEGADERSTDRGFKVVN